MSDDTRSDPLVATGHAEESVSVPTFESTHEKITISVESPEGAYSFEFYVEPEKTEFAIETQPMFEDDDYEPVFPHSPIHVIRAPRRRKHIVNLTAYPIPHPETGVVYVKRGPTKAG